MPPLALAALLALCARAHALVAHDLSAEEYYSMPRLFELDEYDGCLARRGVYCLGSFELSPGGRASRVFDLMQKYSLNWVDNFNHTRLHRGLCVSRRCAAPEAPATPAATATPATPEPGLDTWFASCVNASTMSSHNLSARLYRLEYCARGGAGAGADAEAGTGAELATRALPAALALLLALSAFSTALDLFLSDHTKKEYQWALSWSLPGCWRALAAPPAGAGAAGDLRALDGVRVLCMMCVIVEHVCWLSALSYVDDIRYFETVRRAGDVMLLTNSTLVVQIFFLMASFLLAHKVLRESARGAPPPLSSFFSTMLHRIIRISPSYYMVVWFAATWWERLGAGGPQWAPLVGAEAAVCRRKWWVHLLYLNNVVYPDDKCLVQTCTPPSRGRRYLAADMQLYCAALLLTLLLARWRRAALPLLAALLAASVALVFGLAYCWRLVSTFVMHNPELVRATYRGEPSFNVLYQSPLGNAPGALAGLLLAHAHHALLARRAALRDHRWFRWVTSAGAPLALGWAAASPLLLGAGAPARAPAAALAALERPVFSLFVGLALLGAMHGVRPVWVRALSWAGWAPAARLSFGALLLHMPINKALIAARAAPTALSRPAVLVEWLGVAGAAYLAALPLALLLELPAQRLLQALAARPAPPAARAPAPAPPPEKTNL